MDDRESNEPGADPGVFGGSGEVRICRAAAGGGVRLGGADAGAAPVREPEAAGKGLVRRYMARMTGLSRAQVTRLIGGYAQDGAGEGGSVSAHEVRHALHGGAM